MLVRPALVRDIAPVLVRPFGDQDVAPACELTNHFIVNTAVHFGTQPLDHAQFADLWLTGRDRYPWLAAEIRGHFAGYAKASAWRTREAYALTAEVTVYVALDAHRQGVGRALYARLIADLRRAGFHTAVAGIALPNPGSTGLHESMGFAHIGTFRQAGRKFDQWHDTSWWQLMLS